MNIEKLLIPRNDVRLRQRAMPVGRVRKAERELFDRMYFAMVSGSGIGIAAPQLGVMKRMMICMRDEQYPRAFFFAVDPVIVAGSDEMETLEEGCLSFPGDTVLTLRHSWIGLRWTNDKNVTVVRRLTGLAAVCAQHEIDHLDGITFHMRTAAPEDGKARASSRATPNPAEGKAA